MCNPHVVSSSASSKLGSEPQAVGCRVWRRMARRKCNASGHCGPSLAQLRLVVWPWVKIQVVPPGNPNPPLKLTKNGWCTYPKMVWSYCGWLRNPFRTGRMISLQIPTNNGVSRLLRWYWILSIHSMSSCTFPILFRDPSLQ